jgi:hypothetical protein
VKELGVRSEGLFPFPKVFEHVGDVNPEESRRVV